MTQDQARKAHWDESRLVAKVEGMATSGMQRPTIANTEQLEELLSEPSGGAIDTMRRLQGDFVLLGVGGKMGPTLARMAKRASDSAGVRRRIFGVSRFSSGPLEGQFRSQGIETIR